MVDEENMSTGTAEGSTVEPEKKDEAGEAGATGEATSGEGSSEAAAADSGA